MLYGEVRLKNTHPVKSTTYSGYVGSGSARHAYSPNTLNTCAQKSQKLLSPPLMTRGSVPHSTMPEICIQIKMRALAQTGAYEGDGQPFRFLLLFRFVDIMLYILTFSDLCLVGFLLFPFVFCLVCFFLWRRLIGLST
jgi:hypothetical protein